MNFKKIFVCGIAAVMCLSASAFASEIDVKIDPNGTVVTVSGELGKDMAEKRLMLYCMKSGTGLSNLTAETDTPTMTNAFAAIEYTEANADGKYTFANFLVNGSSDDYKFYVSAADSAKVYASTDVYVASKTDIDTFIYNLTTANGKTNDEERIAAVKSELDSEVNSGLLGLDMPVYELMDDDTREKIADGLKTGVFSDKTVTQKLINIASIKPCLEAELNGASIDMALFPQEYPALSDIAAEIKAESDMSTLEANPVYDILKKLDKAGRVSIFNKAIQIKNDKSLEERIVISIINDQLAGCQGYGDVTGIIEMSKDHSLSALDFDAYNKSKYRNALNETLCQMSFDSCDALVEYITQYLIDAKKETNKKPNYQDSVSFGGGDSSTEYIKPAPVVPQIPQINPDKNTFSDMTDYAWAKQAVESLYAMGVISGKADGIFAPQDYVTREEFVRMIVAAFAHYDPNAKCEFSDVEAGAWYASYVASAANRGIVSGISATEFGVGKYITRQDVAVITANAMGVKSSAQMAQFTDGDKIADYAKVAVSYMKEKGIISGYEDGSFRPENLCMRAEAAQIIYAALDNR